MSLAFSIGKVSAGQIITAAKITEMYNVFNYVYAAMIGNNNVASNPIACTCESTSWRNGRGTHACGNRAYRYVWSPNYSATQNKPGSGSIITAASINNVAAGARAAGGSCNVSVSVGQQVLADHWNQVINGIISAQSAQNKGWFGSDDRCSRSCQIQCQQSCMIACQGCNNSTCHDQNCGGFS